MEKISFVIPCFGSPNILPELTSRIIKQIEKLNFDYEIILVDDCCPKNSFKIIKELSSVNKKIKGILLNKNYGQHKAIAAGLKHANGDWIVVMDCDLQDLPEELPNFIKYRKDYEIIVGLRESRRDSVLKKIKSWIFYKTYNFLVGVDFDGRAGNYGLYSKKVIKNINQISESFRFFPVQISNLGFKKIGVLISHGERKEGKSTYSLRKLLHLATEILIYHTNKPLKISIFLGLVISFFSFFLGCLILGLKFYMNYSVQGWTSLIVSIFFLSGVILFSNGILGIYIGKIFEEVKKREIFRIEEFINF